MDVLGRRATPAVGLAAAILLAATTPAGATDMSGSWAVILSDNLTGEIGVGVLSRGVASGSTVPWAQAGVGAIAILGDVNPEWGPRGLQMLREGLRPEAIADSVRMLDPAFGRMQFGILDRAGTPAGFTGPLVPGWCGGQLNYGVAVQGNTMANAEVLHAMYDSSAAVGDMPLAERLLKALRAGAVKQGMGYDARSAALLVGRYHPTRPEDSARFVYLRVDDHADPLGELERIYALDVASRLTHARLDYIAYFKTLGGRVGPERVRRERSFLGREVERALSDERIGAKALNAMAWGLAGDSALAPEAAKAIAKAMKLAPQSAEVLDTAAELAARAGRAEEAVRLSKEALALAPKDEAYAERLRLFEAAAKPMGRPPGDK